MTWAQTLTPAQRHECRRIMDAHGRYGFRVYMVGTVGPPRHVELRLYDISGRLLRTWMIDADAKASKLTAGGIASGSGSRLRVAQEPSGVSDAPPAVPVGEGVNG
jgi:hypothetical protein